jgi:hypothetical protein
MEWWREVLRKEHDGAADSFVAQLRLEGRWDKATYRRLFDAMLACCKAHDQQEVVERWIAEVFWYLSWWPRLQLLSGCAVSGYHDNALTNFDHLAWWLFAKEARGDHEFEPLE